MLDTGFYDALQPARHSPPKASTALLVLTPYYTNPTQAGIRDYFLRYADASPVPILIYEIPTARASRSSPRCCTNCRAMNALSG